MKNSNLYLDKKFLGLLGHTRTMPQPDTPKVSLLDLLDTDEWRKAAPNHPLAFPCGLNKSGKPVIENLSTM